MAPSVTLTICAGHHVSYLKHLCFFLSSVNIVSVNCLFHFHVHSSKFAISESHEYEFTLFHFHTSEMNWHRVTGLLLECGRANDVICFVFLLLVYPILPVSLDCTLLVVPSVFSNVYLNERKSRMHYFLILWIGRMDL
jgi:hypothetical protein